MTITIGIPVFNQVEFLPSAIESALDQTIKCEVIVCNDGSNDGSLEIANKYPVKVINQVNKGLASARNSLIMNMTGSFFLPLDSDDMLMNNCAEKIQDKINETNADIIAPSFKEFGISQREIILMSNPTIEDFRTGNRIGYLAAIKKSALLEVGGYNPKMVKGFEDYDLWFDLLKRGKILVTIPEILWLYRVKEKSMYTEARKYEYELLSQIRLNHPDIKWEAPLQKPENVIKKADL